MVLSKHVLVTIKLNAASPAVASAGEIEVSVGKGFGGIEFFPPQPSLNAINNKAPYARMVQTLLATQL